METLGTAFQPYKHEIGTTAVYLATAANLSGFAICRNIYKNGTTKDTSPFVFITGVMMGLIKYRTGVLIDDGYIKDINTVAIILNSFFCAFYYIYANDKWNDIIKRFSICMAVAAVMWRYSEWEDPGIVKYRYGLSITVLALSLMSRTMLATKEVIRKKNASQISFLWTLIGTLFATSTILYSSVTGIKFMFIQSTAAFTLNLTRLLLTFVYPGQTPEKKKKQ